MAEDYYKTLEVSRTASAEEIQKAYRKLARKYHPDLNPDDKNAKKRFQEVQQAYDVLNDPKKKSMYDQYGSNFENMQGNPFGGGSGGPQVDLGDLFGGAGGFGGMDINDLLKQFGGGGGGAPDPRARGRRAPRAGADLEAAVTIGFQTAALGGEANIRVDRGTGSESITVKIPPGIEDGKKIRLRGQGQQVPGGKSGDLLLTVSVAPHPCFKRVGSNLEIKLPIGIQEAILGAKVDVPTPGGIVTMTVPPMTSSGQRLRVKGQGVRSKDGTAGDLYVEIHIKLPSEMSDEFKNQLASLDPNYGKTLRSSLVW